MSAPASRQVAAPALAARLEEQERVVLALYLSLQQLRAHAEEGSVRSSHCQVFVEALRDLRVEPLLRLQADLKTMAHQPGGLVVRPPEVFSELPASWKWSDDQARMHESAIAALEHLEKHTPMAKESLDKKFAKLDVSRRSAFSPVPGKGVRDDVIRAVPEPEWRQLPAPSSASTLVRDLKADEYHETAESMAAKIAELAKIFKENALSDYLSAVAASNRGEDVDPEYMAVLRRAADEWRADARADYYKAQLEAYNKRQAKKE